MFKVKRSAMLGKIMTIYATTIKATVDLAYYFNDQELMAHQTPLELEIDNNDFIKVQKLDPLENETETLARKGIFIKVREGDEEPIEFEMEKDASMGDVFFTFCQHKEWPMEKVIFMYGQRQVNAEETPEILNLADGDTLEAKYIEQPTDVSDNFEDETQLPAKNKSEVDKDIISIRVGTDTSVIRFKYKRSIPFLKLMKEYCAHTNSDIRDLRFMFDNTRVTAEMKPCDLDIEDGDTIDVYQRQDGGSF
jgi:hypothetical protein